MPVKDGLYDNRATGNRELWLDGKLVQWVTAFLLAEVAEDDIARTVTQAPPAWLKDWCAYPDVPEEKQ